MRIDDLEAGEELDWLVLHHVFDWKRGIRAFGEAPYRCGTREFPSLLPVSTEIAAAWNVIARASERGLAVSVQAEPREGSPTWSVRFWQESGVEAYGFGETAPLAICRAALRAVEAAMLVKSTRSPAAGAETLN